MTYASGGLIQATDFNTRATSVNTLWGTGANAQGYGQSTTVSTNNVGDIVPASQWATLIARMTSMQQHQFNNTTGVPTAPTSGSIITYLSAVDTEITSLQTNKMVTYNRIQNAAVLGSNATTWQTNAFRTFTVTFSSGDAARYFFNNGGNVYINTTGTALTTTAKATAWNTFITTGFNTYYFNSNSMSFTGTGFTPNVNASSTGYYQLTTGSTVSLELQDYTATADYNLNQMYVNVSTSTQNISAHGDNGSTLTFAVAMYDFATDTFNDTIPGTLSINLGLNYPDNSYGSMTNTWGVGTITLTVNNQQ